MTKKIRVGIIEDDPSIVKMYKMKLEQEGYEVESASNGNLGYDMVVSFKPNVILLDIMMPESGGVDFLSKLRSNGRYDDIRVIVMTNLDDDQMRKSMIDFKVIDYLVKAETTPSQIVEKIKTT